MSILEEIVAYKKQHELPQRMKSLPLEEVRARAAAAPPPCDFTAALTRKLGMALIAEVKKASPSKGLLCPDFDPLRLASTYVSGGASAISVLTDEHFFQGSYDYLQQIRRLYPGFPLLDKDFIIHPYQVHAARAAGADALLLIAAVLNDADLRSLLELTRSLGMEALLEVHDEAELRRVLRLGPRLVGVNNRNLADFKVDLGVSLGLRPLTPVGVGFVAESGIHTRADLQRLAAAGVNAVLVGEALVAAPDVGAAVKELVDGCKG